MISFLNSLLHIPLPLSIYILLDIHHSSRAPTFHHPNTKFIYTPCGCCSLTTIMMSRITLNLRSTGASQLQSYSSHPHFSAHTPATPRALAGRFNDFPPSRKLAVPSPSDDEEDSYPLETISQNNRYSRMPRSPVSSLRFAALRGGEASTGWGGDISPGILITSHTEVSSSLLPSPYTLAYLRPRPRSHSSLLRRGMTDSTPPRFGRRLSQLRTFGHPASLLLPSTPHRHIFY